MKLTQKSETQIKNQAKATKISDFFNGNSFKLFRKFCSRKKIRFVEELFHFNFDDLTKERYFGVSKIKKIKERFNTYDFKPTIIKVDNEVEEENSIQHFKTNEVNEEQLHLLPIFSNSQIEFTYTEIHPSYKLDDSIAALLLSVRATKIIAELGISKIGELLFVLPSDLLQMKNCGKTIITEIRKKIRNFYLNNTKSINNFGDILNQLTGSERQRNIICEYLAVEDKSLPTLKSVGDKNDISRERVRQIVSKISDNESKLFQDFHVPLELIFEQYKGPIFFSSVENDINSLLNWNDKLKAHSYIRFWSIRQNQIKIDRKKNLFWKINDKCVDCDNCRKFINSNFNTKEELEISEILERCSSANCKYELNRVFDDGIKIHYQDDHDDNYQVYVEQIKVNLIFDNNYFELAQKNGISVNKEIEYLLDQLKKKNGSISLIRLQSLSRIKRMNFNSVIFSLNSIIRKCFSKEFLILENDIWEVNPFFNHPSNWKQKGKNKKNNELIDVKVKPNNDEEYPQWLLEQTEELKNILKNRVTSYKFYWFKALLTIVERRETEASFKKMAALMVAHAWNDVLVENCTYTKIDQIPYVVRRIYLDSHLQPTDNIEEVMSYLHKNLNKYDELYSKLLSMVPYRFISIYIENLHDVKDHQKNDIIENNSRKQKLIYKIENSKIYIDKDWNKYLLNNIGELHNLLKNLLNVKKSKCII